MRDDVSDEIVSRITANACVMRIWRIFNFVSDHNIINPNKSITIISLNIHCNKHFDALMLILSSYTNKFDFITFTETLVDVSCVNVGVDGQERHVKKKRKIQNYGAVEFVSKCVMSCVEFAWCHLFLLS